MKPNNSDMLRVAGRAGRWLPEGGAEDLVRFVRAQMTPEGGFRGRGGGADLYYTVFGGACLKALDRWVNPLPVIRYLESFGDGAGLDFVHAASLARCWAALPGGSLFRHASALLARLESFRAADGGYQPAGPGAAEGSVYGGFLACLTYEENGRTPPRPEALLASLAARKTADGGYANAPGAPACTTPATAAAVVLRRRLGGSEDPDALAALRGCEDPGGGFRAAPDAPAPDLLSTATALYALVGAPAKAAHPARQIDFVESLWNADGGFRGHGADPVSDCEYTFYALLALGGLHDG